MLSFSTERLTLRPWHPTEAERLLDIRSRAEVARWLSDTEPWASIEMALDKISEWADKVDRPDPAGVWAIQVDETGLLAGSVNLGTLPGDDEESEIGWYLHPDSTGHGYAREAAKAVIDHALASGVERVWAILWPDNEASARVAEAIGMQDLGVRPDPWYGTEAEPDSRMFVKYRTSD